MRALVIEDDVAIRRLVAAALGEAGLAVDQAATAGEALELAADGSHDVFVVDLGLPDLDGLELIAGLRARGADAPVLILSARRSVAERVHGLDRGGDDYLPKPFAVAELVARVRALLRRRSAGGGAGRFAVADLELDLFAHRAWRAGRELELSPREFEVLTYLAANAGRVLTRTMILDHVWRMRFDPATNVVDVHIHRLRLKVDRDARPLIHTVRAVGYVLRAD